MGMVLWLGLLLAGNLLLVAGLFRTRQTWRGDIEPFRRGSPIFQIMLHPERFATPERLAEIRRLNLFGVICLGAAVTWLACELLVTMLRD